MTVPNRRCVQNVSPDFMLLKVAYVCHVLQNIFVGMVKLPQFVLQVTIVQAERIALTVSADIILMVPENILIPEPVQIDVQTVRIMNTQMMVQQLVHDVRLRITKVVQDVLHRLVLRFEHLNITCVTEKHMHVPQEINILRIVLHVTQPDVLSVVLVTILTILLIAYRYLQ